jgi:hypothetical protein
MKKSFKTNLIGQFGEHLVVAELARREIVASTLAGNVPDVDVLAYFDGKTVAIQVKTVGESKNAFHRVASNYLDIEFDGTRQIVRGKLKDVNRDRLVVAIVIGKKYGEDNFYILNEGWIQDLIFSDYTAYLKKHNGIRPRNPESYHTGFSEKDLLDAGIGANWDLINQAMK